MSTSLVISLAPDGSLQLHLPGTQGTERLLSLRKTQTIDPFETIKQILQAQSKGQLAIGEDGAPTRQQLSHIERHQIFSDDRCPFCIALRVPRDKPYSARFDARYASRKLGDVVVKKIALGECSTKIAGRANAAAAKAARAAKRQEQLAHATISTKSGRDLGY